MSSSSSDSGSYASKLRVKATRGHSITRKRTESFDSIFMERTQQLETEANFSIEEYGAKTSEKEECEEQLLAEYATLLGFYLASAAVLTGITVQQDRLPRKFRLLDLALLG